MPFERDTVTYWCDKCGKECTTDWFNSGTMFLVLACTQCTFQKIYEPIGRTDV